MNSIINADLITALIISFNLIALTALIIWIIRVRDHKIRLETEFIHKTEELESQKKIFIEKNTYFQTFFDSIRDGILVIDLNLFIIDANKTLNDWAAHAQPLNGKKCFEIYQFQSNPCSICPIEQIIANETSYLGEIINEFPNGRKQWLQLHVFPIKNHLGELIGFVEHIRNITDQKTMENDLLRAKERAEDANKAKTEFLANISHEIRTPMNSILGFTEILLNKTESEDQKKYLSNILASGRSLLVLINDILDLSKIEAGKIQINQELFSFKKCLLEIEELFSTNFKEKGIEFKTEIDDSVPEMILLDTIRIRQILVNLVGNALKFTNQGYVTVSVYSDNPIFRGDTVSIFILVKDTGVGIPEKQQKLLFNKFNQHDISLNKKSEGIGLGLPICKRLIEMMNGTITVDSEEGRGSVFKIIFHDVSVVKELDAVPELDNADNTFFDPAVVLIVDDIFSNRALIKAYLEDTKLTVIEADRGQRVLDLLGINEPLKDKDQTVLESKNELNTVIKPDIILMDLRMPGMSGEKAAEIIRNDPQLKDIPMIAVTASESKEMEKRASFLFNSILRKPFSRQQLILQLKACLPHSVSSLNEQTPVKDTSSSDHSDLTDLTQNLSQINQLIQSLEKDYIPIWIEIKEALIYDEISDFSNRIQAMAKEFRYYPLVDWSAELNRHMKTYNIDGLSKTFKKFYKLYEALKKDKYLIQLRENMSGVSDNLSNQPIQQPVGKEI